MSNASTQVVSRQIKVPFHGAELYVVEHNGQPYTPMKPIVDGMGLDWASQFTKIKQRFESCIVEITIQVPGASQRRAAICLPVKKLPGWLHTINIGKIRPELRERVAAYQSECDDALWQYWNDGIAVNPRMAFSVNPGDVLTADQQETLRLMVKTLVEGLPKEKQGGAAIKVWSKLKAHFKVPYRQIPQSEFTEAVSIVTRTAAEWEVVDEEPEPPRKPRFSLDDSLRILHSWYLGGQSPIRVEIEMIRGAVMASCDAIKEANRQLGELQSRTREAKEILRAAQSMLSSERLSIEMPVWWRGGDKFPRPLH